MKPSTFLTAGQASRATGKSIPTITRAVKSGRIANSRKGDDGYEIDPVALSNVYPFMDEALGGKGDDTPQMLGDATPRLDPALQAIVDANRLTIEQLEARIDEKDERINEYQARLSKAENLLTDERSEGEKARAQIELAKKPRKLSWRERLRGNIETA